MENDQLVRVDVFCQYCEVEEQFIFSLHEAQLIQLSQSGNDYYLLTETLPEVEKLCRFHYDLEINIAGIETIQHLLQTIAELQRQNAALKNQLRLQEIGFT